MRPQSKSKDYLCDITWTLRLRIAQIKAALPFPLLPLFSSLATCTPPALAAPPAHPASLALLTRPFLLFFLLPPSLLAPSPASDPPLFSLPYSFRNAHRVDVPTRDEVFEAWQINISDVGFEQNVPKEKTAKSVGHPRRSSVNFRGWVLFSSRLSRRSRMFSSAWGAIN